MKQKERLVIIIYLLLTLSFIFINPNFSIANIQNPSHQHKSSHFKKAHDIIPVFFEENHGQVHRDVIFLTRGQRFAMFLTRNEVTLQFEGTKGMEIDKHGELVLHTEAGEICFQSPFVYQEDTEGQKKKIEGRYILKDNNQVGFVLGNYDKTKAVVIDPKLKFPFVYFTFLGGKGHYEEGQGIAADTNGNVYVTGRTISKDFPTTPGSQDTTCGTDGQCNGLSDAFVAKLNASGSGLVYATYLGGASYDVGQAIAVDSSGFAYATGWTQSADFPTTPGAFQKKNVQPIVNPGQIVNTTDAFAQIHHLILNCNEIT